MSALGETLRALSRAFDELQVGWYVFGAQAVAVHGAPRATQDVDVTAWVHRDQLDDLISTLETVSVRHRFPDQADALLKSASVLPMSHACGMEIDIVLAGSGLERLILDSAVETPIDGVVVPVATSTHLVVLKVLSGRGKDIDDTRALLASGTVEIGEALDLLGQLEQALGQSDLVIELQKLARE